MIDAAPEPCLSVLIPTLVERREQCARLLAELDRQIRQHGLADEVEVLSLLDNREAPVGVKRNALLDRARGDFVAFVDDDDEISPDYVALFHRAIVEHPAIDCVGITGRIVFVGGQERFFIHSTRYRAYRSRGGVYYRPPYHLNPIRRAIATRYRFEPINYSEDIDWAMRLCRDRALQREHFVEPVVYTYHSRRAWEYQRLLDWSEPVRHALGLQLVNRIRLQRWVRARRRHAE
jgi:glycosyltransferase involved in cell wall biosynthesis